MALPVSLMSWSVMGLFRPMTFRAPSRPARCTGSIFRSRHSAEIISQISATDARRFKVIPVTLVKMSSWYRHQAIADGETSATFTKGYRNNLEAGASVALIAK